MTSHVSWLVYNGGLYTEKFKDYQQLMTKAAARHGVEMHPVANDQLLAAVGMDSPLVLPDHLPAPDFIHFADKDIPLADTLEENGFRLFNKAEAVAVCDDKRLMHRAFAASGVRQPATILAPMAYPNVGRKDISYIDRVEKALGLPMVVKEAFGSFGEQVYWVETKEALYDTAARLQGVPHLYQEAVMESFGRDVRLNVIGGKVAASMKRTSEHDFRANVTAGGRTVPYEPTREQKEAALHAARAVGADFAGVDLFLNEGSPIVCEINSNPHVRSIIECTGVHVEDTMIRHMISEGGRV
ncbi:ATP-grasp domain-containing protein [Alkalicoccus saliphilus]|uniref:RimK family alpha-L-glutamate ligase n=1 Tax=Alkalicoccus saliphilus TaxID=200989 RepID=A0A2T4U5J9_9BACI|nr:RimK family alpha-L-glutamate ligase [Alkalicoccus saliphilus]PTL38677.1 RimK family alpha-L-glutamate ligase [Alkalicoccus saliphilus]